MFRFSFDGTVTSVKAKTDQAGSYVQILDEQAGAEGQFEVDSAIAATIQPQTEGVISGFVVIHPRFGIQFRARKWEARKVSAAAASPAR